MFDFIEDYDVQETRRIAREEGRLEIELEYKIETALNIIKEVETTVTKAMKVIKLPEDKREQLIFELNRLNIPFIP